MSSIKFKNYKKHQTKDELLNVLNYICSNKNSKILFLTTISNFKFTFSSETSRDFKLLPTTRSSSSSSTILLEKRTSSVQQIKRNLKLNAVSVDVLPFLNKFLDVDIDSIQVVNLVISGVLSAAVPLKCK